MSIDEYSKQLLPESKSTQIGNPAWTFVNCCVWAMLQLVSFQSAFIFQTLVLFFMRSCFSKSFQLSQRFQLSWRFYFIQGALFFLYSAFLFLHKRLSNFAQRFSQILCVSQHLYIFSNCELERYFTFLPNCHAAIISIS